MTKKTFILRSIDLIPGLGNDRDGVPFRWLSSMVEKVRALVPDDEESSCMVRGAAGLTFEYQHTLSETEQLQASIADLQAKAAQIKALLPRDGGLTPEQADRLREIVG